MSTKIAKGTARQERPKLKVMHVIEKDNNGNASITSRTVPKLKEAVGPDVQQAAEETGHKLPKTVKPAKVEKGKDEMSTEQHKILRALDSLGGKDVDSMSIAKKAVTTHTHPDDPRQPVRQAMEQFEKLGFAKRERKGIKWLFSIADKGRAALPRTRKQDQHQLLPPLHLPKGQLTLIFNALSATR